VDAFLSQQWWFPAAVALYLTSAAAAVLLARVPRLCRVAAFGGSLLGSALIVALAVSVLAGAPVSGRLGAHAASGIAFGYAVTPLAAWFLLVLGLVSAPVALYSIGYLPHAVPDGRTALLGASFNVLIAAVAVVFAAADVITFLLAWEVMTLATAALVATEHEIRSTRRAAYVYLVMSHVGTGALLAGFLILASATGSMSFEIVLAGDAAAGPWRHVLFGLFFLGFGVKAGVIPLHVWLPDAHPAAPSSISALMSAVLIKAGIYGLFRVCAFGLGVPEVNWGLAVMALGALSAILGVLYALAQSDLKRLLAYSTIENAGIILLGLGSGMTAAAQGRAELAAAGIAASLFHVLNHALFKGLLFLSAGSVVMASGTRLFEELGGLIRRLPWTAAFFLVGALAVSGLPPLNGFVSEWLTFQALLLGFASLSGVTRMNFPLAGALLAMTSALAAACFVKAFGTVFLALPRSRAVTEAHESPAIMLVPQGWLALLCVGVGLFPGAVLGAIGRVLVSLPGLRLTRGAPADALTLSVSAAGFDHVAPAALGVTLAAGLVGAAMVVAAPRLRSWQASGVRRVPTWGCGGELGSANQYTGPAFSKPLMMVFRMVLRPTREVEALADVSPYFPREVRYRTAIEPVFERYLYRPLATAVLGAAGRLRVLQAGSLHAYLAYVLVLGVVLLIWLGGMR
jgi:hydrogenase-4 component B